MAEFTEYARPFQDASRRAGWKERSIPCWAGVAALGTGGCAGVHDGLRPCMTGLDPLDHAGGHHACHVAAQEAGASVSAEPVTDTLHRADGEGRCIETVSVTNLWRMQTPAGIEARDLRALWKRLAGRRGP